MDLSELPQLRGLRGENARLKRLVADQALHRICLRRIPPELDQPNRTRDDFAAWLVQGARGAPPSATPATPTRGGTA